MCTYLFISHRNLWLSRRKRTIRQTKMILFLLLLPLVIDLTSCYTEKPIALSDQFEKFGKSSHSLWPFLFLSNTTFIVDFSVFFSLQKKVTHSNVHRICFVVISFNVYPTDLFVMENIIVKIKPMKLTVQRQLLIITYAISHIRLIVNKIFFIVLDLQIMELNSNIFDPYKSAFDGMARNYLSE